MVTIRLPETFSILSLHQLSLSLGEQVSAHSYNICHSGNGNIRLFEIEDGVHLYSMDCTFNDHVEIMQPSFLPVESFFVLSFYLGPNIFLFRQDQDAKWDQNKCRNTTLGFGVSAFAIHLPPNVPLRCIHIYFSRKWIETNMPAQPNVPYEGFWHAVKSDTGATIFDSMSRQDYELIYDIFENSFWETTGLLLLRSKILSLIGSFIVNISYDRVNRPRYHHLAELQEVETRLLSMLEGSLPLIKDLAKEVYLSESTLQREFKKVYGKNIYEYYLEKKMDHARHLLNTEKITVAETAYRLGYENISQFIAMFKRHFGKSPGALHREVA
jgi:AraC-like DNA-binding protein